MDLHHCNLVFLRHAEGPMLHIQYCARLLPNSQVLRCPRSFTTRLMIHHAAKRSAQCASTHQSKGLTSGLRARFARALLP